MTHKIESLTRANFSPGMDVPILDSQSSKEPNWMEALATVLTIGAALSIASQIPASDTPNSILVPTHVEEDNSSDNSDVGEESVYRMLPGFDTFGYKTLTEVEYFKMFLSMTGLGVPAIKIDINLSISTYGEIDMILKFPDNCLLVVECKNSKTKSVVKRGKKQAKKYSAVLDILQPKHGVVGIVFCNLGMCCVYDNFKEITSSPVLDFLDSIGHTRSHLT